MRVTFTINKDAALREVRRLTAYGGNRKIGDEGAYLRMSATESDEGMLEQFWKAACSAATEQLMHYAVCIANEDEEGVYEVVAKMSSLYDTNLNSSIQGSLMNFIVNFIVSKWYKLTSPEDEAKYAADAIGYMADIERKIYFRKRPTR